MSTPSEPHRQYSLSSQLYNQHTGSVSSSSAAAAAYKKKKFPYLGVCKKLKVGSLSVFEKLNQTELSRIFNFVESFFHCICKTTQMAVYENFGEEWGRKRKKGSERDVGKGLISASKTNSWLHVKTRRLCTKHRSG